jgi:hypothetical protein
VEPRTVHRVEAIALVLSSVAVAVSVASALYTRRQAHAAAGAERRALTPILTVTLEEKVDSTANTAIYRIRNDGPQDLDELSVHPPRTEDGIRYPVAPVGNEWPEDPETKALFGPLPMGQSARFYLAVGVREEVPEFRIRVEAQRGSDTWEQVILLEPPRFRGFHVY